MNSLSRASSRGHPSLPGEVAIPLSALKGRGAASRLAHRFQAEDRQAFDDGWSTLEAGRALAGEAAPPATELTWELARSALSFNESPDLFFDRALNPYRGCEHGCIYCYARPTHSYLHLSPGLDFETKLIAKGNIAEVLRQELGRRGYRPGVIALGSATDAYQPVERELRLTRAVLELLRETSHPVSLVTKSAGVERDIDLLAPMAREGLVSVFVTVTTLDPVLARQLEPRAAAPHRRLRTIRTLAEAGIPVGVSLAPQIAFLNDDMQQVMEAAAEAGAHHAFYQALRLPWEVAPLFRQWLEVHHPARAARVMARVQDMRGGKDYDADFATRMKGEGLWAQLLARRFERARDRLGFNRQALVHETGHFRPPGQAGQGRLF